MDRFLLKEFAKTPTIQTGVYGSEQQGSPTYSEDYETIQSGVAWEEGIGGATSNATQQPAINDDQGVYKVLCKAIKNGQISGIPLYLATETYQKGSIVSILDGNDKPIIYYSLTNNNINNNPLTDGAIHWVNYASAFVKTDGSNAIFNNLSPTAKAYIKHVIIPDFSVAGEQYTLPWIATYDGFISVSDDNSMTKSYVTINGNRVGDDKLYNSFQGFVRTGDIITTSAGVSGYELYFWKLEL